MPATGDHTWTQVHLHLATDTPEEHAVRLLGPALIALEDQGLIGCWHFLRKGDRWRLRYREAASGTLEATATAAAVNEVLDMCREAGMISDWTPAIYEPETYVFGGAAALPAAHRLFHQDSRHALTYLTAVHRGELSDQRAELWLLLGTAAMRGAGLDWYEIGDTWAQVAENRSADGPGLAVPDRRLVDAARTLLQADTTPGSALLEGRLAHAASWFGAFAAYGLTLRTLADEGQLWRGQRAVLAHHQLFTANRLGLPYHQQAALASAAAGAVLDLVEANEAVLR
ncbi:thiopeptide-type bacteriocin biosynthesis protein [Kitasatospora sp. YST-16]|uniref:thiopeptide-type bacteriocin biosynthesis protein n=1 Tax=Kitasatospora sp. YST-16 TaxID=2998080 RepID=UPI0022847A05|nr:thiopeptide-type bacteriocin biosynthesis protein [Kitasatospora sp. YST-16]WAL70508.1 thiopeptide-type bacteriocin biosynthesis protein [Kitasatospora sp. YST-16]WNW36548.1 thiopeptide-type bacteriocin biosynthesis protein [Streptomyces sp. Li-HN-5-13]